MSALSFLEKVSTPQDIDGDTVENVALTDAIYATKVAVLEFCEDLMSGNLEALYNKIDNKMRQLKKDRVKLEA